MDSQEQWTPKSNGLQRYASRLVAGNVIGNNYSDANSRNWSSANCISMRLVAGNIIGDIDFRLKWPELFIGKLYFIKTVSRKCHRQYFIEIQIAGIVHRQTGFFCTRMDSYGKRAQKGIEPNV